MKSSLQNLFDPDKQIFVLGFFGFFLTGLGFFVPGPWIGVVIVAFCFISISGIYYFRNKELDLFSGTIWHCYHQTFVPEDDKPILVSGKIEFHKNFGGWANSIRGRHWDDPPRTLKYDIHGRLVGRKLALIEKSTSPNIEGDCLAYFPMLGDLAKSEEAPILLQGFWLGASRKNTTVCGHYILSRDPLSQDKCLEIFSKYELNLPGIDR